MIKVPVHVLPLGNKENLPKYETAGSAGLDLSAAIDAPLVLEPGARLLVPTGISCAIPKGYEGQIRSRSGLSWKHGVIVLNAPGTIDSDYRGEIKVMLMNLGQETFEITPSMRIAQIVFAPYATASWQEVSSLEESTTERGAGGFGSTGV